MLVSVLFAKVSSFRGDWHAGWGWQGYITGMTEDKRIRGMIQS